jgi:hypothetical protein
MDLQKDNLESLLSEVVYLQEWKDLASILLIIDEITKNREFEGH